MTERGTILTCGHPKRERWVSDCGWVEVCGVCSECRRTEDGKPKREHWKDAIRWVRRIGDQLVMFGEDGLVVRRDAV